MLALALWLALPWLSFVCVALRQVGTAVVLCACAYAPTAFPHTLLWLLAVE